MTNLKRLYIKSGMKKNIPEFVVTDHASDLKSCINKVERLSNCIEIANLINSELSIGKLLSNVMTTTQKVFLAESVSLLLIDEKTGDLTFQIALGEVGDDIKELYRLKKGKGIAGLVAETGMPLNLEDAYEHPNFSSEADRKTGYRTRAMLCVPLKIKGEIIGVIQVINKQTSPFVFTNEELEMLMTISSSAAVAIDTARMHRIILQRETLERDLKLAREVQESFLPKDLPVIVNYRFAVVNQPALEIGGDFYNFFKLPSDKLGIVLGDVSGKGISASLGMARLTSDLQYYTLVSPEPKNLLARINQVLCERAKGGMFVTLIYLLLDPQKNRLQIANAGHLPPVYCDQNGPRLLGNEEKKGPPLGILPDAEYHQETFDLAENASITLFTDGVIEAKNTSAELFGLKRVLKVIKSRPNNPEAICRGITNAVDRFTATEGRSDDLTLLSFTIP